MESSKPIDQYVYLVAKSSSPAETASVILRALGDPTVFVYGELLALPPVQDLEKLVETKPVWDALQLFAFGVYADFIPIRAQLPQLSDLQLNKLRQMTIVSLASHQKHLPYASLLSALGLSNVRQLEDLIIEAIYADILQGKLDQKNQTLEVSSTLGRDVKPEEIAKFTTVLTDWCDRCKVLLLTLEEQMSFANQVKSDSTRHKSLLEEELINLRKTIKATGKDDSQPMDVSTSGFPQLPTMDDKKKEKRRGGLRGSNATKFWKT